MNEKQRFLSRYESEHAKTANVLRAFPGDKSEFRPHERSNSAHALGWMFVLEEQLLLKAIRGEEVLGSGFPSPPDSWDKIIDAFHKGYDDVVAELKKPSDGELPGTVKFMTGPKQVGDVPRATFANFMLDDQIHHRGQMSVYIRMCGGKVPAIYGPSADEPWN